MERRIVQKVAIAEVILDADLYPRANYNWQTGYDYAQSMRTGAKFPIITLARLDDKLVLVDGRHRLEANKILKAKEIEAEIFVGWSKNKVFEEAIKRNISHGRVFSPYEKRMIALKLKAMKYNFSEISEIIQVPQDKLQNFIAQRLVNSITGETIKEIIVKSPLKHIAGKSLNESEASAVISSQTEVYSRSQATAIDELIDLLEGGLLNVDDAETMHKLKVLQVLIEKVIN